jgi:cytochrome c biogenesis protein CcmG, thiol:disulfide interchange protein DsbE
MTRFARLSALRLLATGLLVVSLHAQAATQGAPAPAFNLPSTSGNLKLDDLKGRWVYVDFWASWCGPCRQSFPWMNEMQTKFGDKLRIVGINLDAKRADADKFLAQTPAKFMLAFDDKGDTPKAYKIKGMPSSVLIAPDGTVAWIHTGFKEGEAKELEEKLAKSISGK